MKKKNNEIKLFSFILLLKRKPSVDFENEANIKESERVMVLIQKFAKFLFRCNKIIFVKVCYRKQVLNDSVVIALVR